MGANHPSCKETDVDNEFTLFVTWTWKFGETVIFLCSHGVGNVTFLYNLQDSFFVIDQLEPEIYQNEIISMP